MGKHTLKARLFAFSLLAFLPLLVISATATAANHSTIFVVDTSERISPHLQDIKDTILSYCEQSERGDYLAVISFSEIAKLLAMKKISGPTDRKSLEIMLEALTPRGDVALIDRGLERAVEEVVTLKRRGDKNIKGIILISASELPQDYSLENLERVLQDALKVVSPDEYYVQYCYLDGVKDNQIAAFVKANDGFSYDIDALQAKNGTETIGELYKIAIVPEESCAVTAADVQGAVLKTSAASADEWVALKAGESVEEGTTLSIAENSRLVLDIAHFGGLGLAPATEMVLEQARTNPISGRTDINIRLESGSIWANKVDKSAFLRVNHQGYQAELAGRAGSAIRAEAGGDLEVLAFSSGLEVKEADATPEVLSLGQNQTVFMKAGHLVNPPLSADARSLEEWKYWSRVLLKGVSLDSVEFAIPEVGIDADVITLGPLQPGKTLSEKIPLHLRNVAEPSKLKVVVDVSVLLPKGISITTALLEGEEPDVRELLLQLDGTEGFASSLKEEHKGLLFVAPAADSPIHFEKISIPLTIITKKRLLSMHILIFGLIVAGLGIAGYASKGIFRKKENVRPRPHRVIGRLIIIDDPTRGRTGSINLEEVGTKSSRLSLVIGRDKASEIRLKHTSVQPKHCFIEAHLVGNHLVTYIEPISAAVVLVDDGQIQGKTRLADGNKIGIGEFSFQFEDTQFYKKVAVVYSNGRSITGVLDASGMDADGFKISPIDAVSPSERARVKFSDIRSVTFHRRTADILAQKPRPQAKHAAMKHVELMFKRGDTIAGYIQREYTEGRHRFVELLPLDQNSDIDYIVVDYSAVVEKKVF